MKNQFVLVGLLIAAMVIFFSCTKENKKEGVQNALSSVTSSSPDLSVIEVDSVVYDKVWPLSAEYRKEGGYFKPSYHAVLDVPSFKQAPLLANAVMEWVSENLIGSDIKDLSDVKGMLALDAKHQSEQEDFADSETFLEFRKLYENEKLITFLCTYYSYNYGAVHGLGYSNGVTFRKSDGKRFGWNLFRSSVDLQPFLKKGLKEYFEVRSDSELKEALLLMEDSYSVDYLPKPTTEPWVEKTGIVMKYQPYEIASYAVGHPTVKIPLSQAKGMFTLPAKKLFE